MARIEDAAQCGVIFDKEEEVARSNREYKEVMRMVDEQTPGVQNGLHRHVIPTLRSTKSNVSKKGAVTARISSQLSRFI